MLHYLEQQYHISGGAVKDYTLAGALTTSPLWAHWLTDINSWLTFAGLVVGLVLGLRRLWRDFRDNRTKSQ